MKRIERLWNRVKSDFVLGKDYIETETDEYIVFCPFNQAVLAALQDAFFKCGCKYKMSHCVCWSQGAYAFWFERLYQDGRLKTFFISKNINLRKFSECQPMMAEFTGWIDFSDPHFLHFAHLVNNDLATGEYVDYMGKYAYDRHVTEKYKEYVDRMNEITAEVYNDLFEQYGQHIFELEETLHRVVGKICG